MSGSQHYSTLSQLNPIVTRLRHSCRDLMPRPSLSSHDDVHDFHQSEYWKGLGPPLSAPPDFVTELRLLPFIVAIDYDR